MIAVLCPECSRALTAASVVRLQRLRDAHGRPSPRMQFELECIPCEMTCWVRKDVVDGRPFVYSFKVQKKAARRAQ